MVGATKRRLWVALIAVVALAAVAFDAVVPPITIQNSTDERVSISNYEDDFQRPLNIRAGETGPFSRSLVILAGDTYVIEFAGVVPTWEYFFTINYALGSKTNLYTLSDGELDQRDWKLEITPEGIQ